MIELNSHFRNLMDQNIVPIIEQFFDLLCQSICQEINIRMVQQILILIFFLIIKLLLYVKLQRQSRQFFDHFGGANIKFTSEYNIPLKLLPIQMKRTIAQQIRQLKKTQMQTKAPFYPIFEKQNRILVQAEKTEKDNDQRSESVQIDKMFQGLLFCLPVVDVDLIPKKIELLSKTIRKHAGKVIELKQKLIEGCIDYVLVNPEMKVSYILQKIKKNLKFKEIIDYHFINDSINLGRLVNPEKYSMFVNIEGFQQDDVFQQGMNPSKKRKLNEAEVMIDHEVIKEEDENSDKTQKLEDEDEIDVKNEQEKQKFSMNAFIGGQLMKLQKIYETERDIGRKIAYMKAASAIKGLDKQIESQEDLKNVPGIGKKLIDKIKQLMKTGKLQKLQKLQQSEQTIICQQFCKVWGIGPAKAHEIYKMGIKSIDELKKRTDLLNKNQKLGLKYFEEFQQKIPRQKVSKIFEFVKNVLETMVPSISMYQIEVCGSYRRGKATCGDIDIIISRKDGHYQKTLLFDIVNQLQKQGLLTDHLTKPKISNEVSSVSYMGICQFEDSIHHRIDIKYYPIHEYAFALLYFTGSGQFNRNLRIHAIKIGLQLSDTGVIAKADKNGTIWKKNIPTCYTEEDIFKLLGVEYKTPKQRDL